MSDNYSGISLFFYENNDCNGNIENFLKNLESKMEQGKYGYYYYNQIIPISKIPYNLNNFDNIYDLYYYLSFMIFKNFYTKLKKLNGEIFTRRIEKLCDMCILNNIGTSPYELKGDIFNCEKKKSDFNSRYVVVHFWVDYTNYQYFTKESDLTLNLTIIMNSLYSFRMRNERYINIKKVDEIVNMTS